VTLSKLDAEFLRYMIFNAAGHTNQARIVRAIGTAVSIHI